MSQVREPAGFAEVIDRPIAFVRAHLRPLLIVHLALLLPLSIVTGAVQSTAQLSMFSFTSEGSQPDFSILPFALVYGASFVFLFGTMISYVATYSATRRLLDGEPVSVGAAYREALRPRSLTTLFLTGVIVMAGFMCCIAPGVLALIYFAFAIPILCEGTDWGWSAIERSFRLVRYNPSRDFVKSTSLKIFLLFLVMGAISYAVTLLIALPSIVVGMMIAFRSASKGFEGLPSWYPVFGALQQVLSTIATSFVAIYGAAVFTMLYRDTRERMEGASLERALLDRLGPAPSEPRPGDTGPPPSEPRPREGEDGGSAT